MSDDQISKVLQAPPGTGAQVVDRMRTHGWTFEDTYTALVRLHDQGRAFLAPCGHPNGARIWQ